MAARASALALADASTVSISSTIWSISFSSKPRDVMAGVPIRRPLVAKGLRRILAQIDDPEKWLANKAANDAVNFGKARLYAESDNKVVIEFADGAGMPNIGTPETDEAEEE